MESLKLKSSRVYILPTSIGWVFFIFCVVILISSAIFDNKGQQFLGFFLLGIFALVLTLAHFNLVGFELQELDLSNELGGAFEGQEVLFAKLVVRPFHSELAWKKKTSLTDKAHRIEQVQVQVFTRSAQKLKKKGSFSKLEFNLPDMDLVGTKEVAVSSAFDLKKGNYLIEKVIISSTFPFGLFCAWKKITYPERLWVFACPESKHFDQVSFSDEQLSQSGASARRTSGLDFDGVKEVQMIAQPRRLMPQQDIHRGTWLVKDYKDTSDSVPVLHWPIKASKQQENQLLRNLSYLALHAPAFKIESAHFTGWIQQVEEKQKALRKFHGEHFGESH